ncbi:MAG: 1-deoxy-D-xylulose-5-phosphate synthase [Puniceicoccales bacterium]|jgi:1-deoxy-D-xylulose-5-phosphate synthase|nr:1-deoxy-D-xylulose-5-phosphate synthase [Puniceicoccales bacterium]
MENEDYKKTAQEIREIILKTTQSNGGHLASNLGVVELSIALHRVFDSPRDKIIFDVSHQCYAHKILTDRRDKFSTLRQTHGISGFTAPVESPHDVFFCGHGGTALSSAMGMAVARDQLHRDYHVIAVIGDASLTNGLTLEALNNMGKNRLIVILNDNGYAISKNVGSIAKYLNGMTRHRFYNNIKTFLKKYAIKLPGGEFLVKLLAGLKQTIKSLLLPSSFFEHYGLKYVGPIDGHNVNELLENLEFCKGQNRPLLLHIKTKKGHGDSHSESSPEKTHGISPPTVKCRGYSVVFGQKICDLAKDNSRIVCITAAMVEGTGLALFQRQYAERCFDVGIAEGHALTFSAGLSRAGLLPVCAIYSTFLQRAFDNIFHDIALQNLPIIVAIDRAGLCANDGPTHHGLFDIAFLRSVPNLVIMQPKDPEELEAMLEAAVNFGKSCCIRYPREVGSIRSPGHSFPGQRSMNVTPEIQLGKSETIRRGKEICLIALGEKVGVAVEIAQKLPQFSFTIINGRFVKPLDGEMLTHCAQNHRLLYTIEDHVKSGGFGSAVLEFLGEKNLKIDAHIFAWPDEFIPHASNGGDLEKMFHFTVGDMIKKIQEDYSNFYFKVYKESDCGTSSRVPRESTIP